MSSFDDVLYEIQSNYDPTRPNFIYIAVGSANNAEQQCLPFLIILSIEYDVKISIILIDGELEDDPLGFPTALTYGMTMYTLKEFVIFNDTDIKKNTYNYTNQLKKMNDHCINTNTTLVYQSYTGVYMKEIAELFDIDITNHLNHIIYGIGERDNTGCFIDFTNKKYEFITKNHSLCIHIYNPYYYSINNKPFDEAIDFYGIENLIEIAEKNNNAKNIVNEYFIEKILPVLRIFFLILKDPNENLNPYIWSIIPPNNLNLYDLYSLKQYDKLFKQIKMLYSQSLIIKSIISFANLKCSPIEFIDEITIGNNPYKWVDQFKMLVQN